jgi:hypothetical protein
MVGNVFISEGWLKEKDLDQKVAFLLVSLPEMGIESAKLFCLKNNQRSFEDGRLKRKTF